MLECEQCARQWQNYEAPRCPVCQGKLFAIEVASEPEDDFREYDHDERREDRDYWRNWRDE